MKLQIGRPTIAAEEDEREGMSQEEFKETTKAHEESAHEEIGTAVGQL